MQEQKKTCRNCRYHYAPGACNRPTPGACNHPKIESMLLIDKVLVSSDFGCVLFKAILCTFSPQTSTMGTRKS